MKYRGQWRLWLVILTTILLLAGSLWVWLYVNKSVNEGRERELNRTLDQIALAIEFRIDEAVDILYDLKGLMSLGEIDKDQWHGYARALLEGGNHKEYSFAYVEKMSREKVPMFEKMMRSSKDPRYENFSVFPKLESEFSYPIKYLISSDPDIKTLLGLDFQYSERTIVAIDMAKLTGRPTLSELTHLNTIIPSSKKSGYEIILPFKEVGFLGAWIKLDGLITTEINLKGLRYSLYDGDEEVFTSGILVGNPLMRESKEFVWLNRKFKIVLETDRSFQLSTFEENLPKLTMIAIISINLLWMMSLLVILSSRKGAIDLAETVTKDLRKFKQAVDGVSDQVIIANPEGVVIYANNAAAKITGYATSEMIGSKPSLWRGQMSKEFYQKFWKTIKEDKKPYWGEIRNKRKNGELYEAEIHVSPILGDRGELLFFVGVERDLSKAKAIEKIKTEFISLASHQLRTPLSAVKWFGEMLLDGNAGKLTKLQEDYVTKIFKSNEREIELVNSLLNVSRIESGKIVVTKKMVDLRELVENIINDIKINKIWMDKHLTYTLDKEISMVELDPDLIKHVYINILNNAASYTNGTGKISLKVYLKNGKVISEIKDEGIGIPKEEQDRVFDRFFRASNAMKKNTDGNGLGLYLSKAIIESSGGKIWFTSREGKGTTFVFSLPVKSANRDQGKTVPKSS